MPGKPVPRERSLMMTLRIENAAFDEPRAEIARILEETARRIRDGATPPMSLFDVNGNRVGEFTGKID
jgi:hypothetical protein